MKLEEKLNYNYNYNNNFQSTTTPYYEEYNKNFNENILKVSNSNSMKSREKNLEENKVFFKDSFVQNHSSPQSNLRQSFLEVKEIQSLFNHREENKPKEIKEELARLLHKAIEYLKVIENQRQNLNKNPSFEIYSFLKYLSVINNSLSVNHSPFISYSTINSTLNVITKEMLYDYCIKEGITSTYNTKNSKYFLSREVLNCFFSFFDSNKDGVIDYDEFVSLTLTELNISLRTTTTQRKIKIKSDCVVNSLIAELSSTFDDFSYLIKLEIDFSREWLSWSKSFKESFNLDSLGLLYVLDSTDKGFIDFLDLYSFIQFYFYTTQAEEVQLLLNRLDVNKDGKISINDLESLFFSGSSAQLNELNNKNNKTSNLNSSLNNKSKRSSPE